MKALNIESLSLLSHLGGGALILCDGQPVGHLVEVVHVDGQTEIKMALDGPLGADHDEGGFAHLAIMTGHDPFEFVVAAHELTHLAPGAIVGLTLAVAGLVAHAPHQEERHRGQHLGR